MPEGNQAVMEAIRDEVVTIATKAQAEGNKGLLRALAAVPTEFPELTKEIARIDAEILSVRNDMAKRPKCGPVRCPDKIGQSRIKQPEQFSNTSC